MVVLLFLLFTFFFRVCITSFLCRGIPTPSYDTITSLHTQCTFVPLPVVNMHFLYLRIYCYSTTYSCTQPTLSDACFHGDRRCALCSPSHRCRTVVFDKTGTLTEGSFDVVSECWLRNQDAQAKQRIWDLVCALQVRSTHPIAASIVRHATG